MKAIIEMPMGTTMKYEMGPDGHLHLDRPSRMAVPYSYGFIPGTLAQDGDPLDVFVLSHEPLVPGCYVDIEPIFMYVCDDNGEGDDKVVARIKGDEQSYPVEIVAIYLSNYKDGFTIKGVVEGNEMNQLIEATRI